MLEDVDGGGALYTYTSYTGIYSGTSFEAFQWLVAHMVCSSQLRSLMWKVVKVL